MLKLLLLVCAFLFNSDNSVTVKVNGVNSTSGQLAVAVYTNQESFKERLPFRTMKIDKSSLKNGSITFQLSIPPGNYGIALLDDENSNNKMDYRFFMPQEGFGFSNYYHDSLRQPTFDDFDFDYQGGNKTIEIKVKYM
jgi:uncharacterized protein (DUF2141 family)